MSNIRYALNRLAVLSLASCLLTGPAIAQTGYTDLIAFGDSFTDTGNVSAVFGLPLPPYAAGRLTNGPVWLEGLAGSLGLSAVSSLNGGGNYAWGGARTGPGTGGGGLPPYSLLDQADFYLSDVGGVADPDALYVIWGGGNDARDNDVADSAADIAAIISSLAAAGATNFLVPNLPDMGMTPESQAGGAPGGTAAQITAATLAHNGALASELSALSATLTNVTIFEMDVFGLFNELLSNPAGFANVTDPCWDGDIFGNGNECADPDAHLFWDANSPSAVAHSILGNSATNLVGNVGVCGDSEPATGEQCDDGNTAAGDGCDATCQIEAGSDCTAPVAGILAPPAIVIPPVPSMCLVGLCGDGIASDGEACDDGNLAPGDGCSATCSIENGFSCTAATTALEVLMGADLNPSFCTPDIDDLSGRAKSGKVSLTWSPVINADSYNIYRGDSSGGPYDLIAASHATTYAAYSDGTVTNGSTYYYVVTAITDGFESNQSNEAEVTVRGRTRR